MTRHFAVACLLFAWVVSSFASFPATAPSVQPVKSYGRGNGQFPGYTNVPASGVTSCAAVVAAIKSAITSVNGYSTTIQEPGCGSEPAYPTNWPTSVPNVSLTPSGMYRFTNGTDWYPTVMVGWSCPTGYTAQGTGSSALCVGSGYQCSANATLSGTTCTCDAGYEQVNGACQKIPTCTAGSIKPGYVDSIGQSGSVCSAADGCVYSGSAPSGSPISYYAGTVANPVAMYAVSFVNTGKSCASQNMTGVGTSLIDVMGGKPDAITCPAGTVFKLSGGVGACGAPSATSPSTGSQTAPGGGGDAAPGSSPSNPINIDKSGLATDATLNANAQTAHADAAAIKASIDALNMGGGNHSVVIDETGTPDDSSLAASHQSFDNAAGSLQDQITSVGGSRKVTTLDWVWSPTIPTGGCEVLDLSGKWGTGLSVDLCQGGHVDQLRAILAWVYAFCVAIYVWHRLSGAPGGGK